VVFQQIVETVGNLVRTESPWTTDGTQVVRSTLSHEDQLMLQYSAASAAEVAGSQMRMQSV